MTKLVVLAVALFVGCRLPAAGPDSARALGRLNTEFAEALDAGDAVQLDGSQLRSIVLLFSSDSSIRSSESTVT